MDGINTILDSHSLLSNSHKYLDIHIFATNGNSDTPKPGKLEEIANRKSRNECLGSGYMIISYISKSHNSLLKLPRVKNYVAGFLSNNAVINRNIFSEQVDLAI